MNGKFVVKKQGRQNIFPSAGARGLTSSCTLPPAPPSMKKLRSKGLYLVISLRHFGVTWDAHARCWSVCLQYCEWILPFFKGNLQHHHFIFIVYYQGRKVSSSFLWLTSFFFHSLVVFLLTCSMKLPHQQPMLPAPPTKARTKESHALIVPFLPSPSFFFFLYHSRWILSPTRLRMLCNSFVPDWWQDRIVIKLQLTGKSRLILCLFSNFCVFSFNIR